MFVYVLFLIMFLAAPFVLFLFMYSAVENRARRIVELLPGDLTIKYIDVRIWFKGYDVLKKANRFQIDPSKSLYVYNLADLYVYKRGIVVVGKARAWAFGRIRLLSPFAICWPGAESQLSMVLNRVSYIGAEVVGEDVDIQFQDREYTNTIKLEVKQIGREVYSKISANV
jgi:hypothetical protein